VYVLSSTIAAVATGPCAQPRVMTATAPIKAATPAHFDIVISLPRRRSSALGCRHVCLISNRSTRRAPLETNRLGLVPNVREEDRAIPVLQPLLDEGPKDNL